MSKLLTVTEIAKILRVDDSTVRRWIKEGVLEAVVLPGTPGHQAYRIKRETLDTILGIEREPRVFAVAGYIEPIRL